MADELPEHDVAIVVYARVRADVDIDDAAILARVALRRTLGLQREGTTIQAHMSGESIDVVIAGLEEVGLAARNGSLWLAPTR